MYSIMRREAIALENVFKNRNFRLVFLGAIASVLAGAILQSVGSTALLAVCSVGFLTAALILLFNKAKNEI